MTFMTVLMISQIQLSDHSSSVMLSIYKVIVWKNDGETVICRSVLQRILGAS